MFPSPDGELVGLDFWSKASTGVKPPAFLFPSPDGELVGLDREDDFLEAVLITAIEFPSPDGELVGLDLRHSPNHNFRNLECFRPLTGNW